MLAITTRVAPRSAMRQSQTASMGSQDRWSAISAIVVPAYSGWCGEIAIRTASQEGMRPKLVNPDAAMSARIRVRIAGAASRARIVSTPPS